MPRSITLTCITLTFVAFGLLMPKNLIAEDTQELQRQISALRETQEFLAEQIAALQLEAGDPQRRASPWSFDLSVITTAIAGTSTATNDQLEVLQGGGHDPKVRGFSVPNVELGFTGAVDKYASATVRLATFISSEGETEIELEEAFAASTYLPFSGLVKLGQFFTPFGFYNSNHPHAWAWIDQPIINSRIFGPDGMRAPGAHVSCDIPVRWTSQAMVTMQNANGETMRSFAYEDGETLAGRPVQSHEVKTFQDVVTVFGWYNSLKDNNLYALHLGFNYAMGPNANSDNSKTSIYGAHISLRRDGLHSDGTGMISWFCEFTNRDYQVADYIDDPDGIVGNADDTFYMADTVTDWGVTSEIRYGINAQWSIGMRGEIASGHGESVGGRDNDAARDDRWRISPLITWSPSAATRARLQYNIDHAQHLQNDLAHTVWLGIDVVLGGHPAHNH